MALMTSLVWPAPFASSTFRLTIDAPGATPRKLLLLAADDPRHVRAVPEVVDALAVRPGEIEAGGDVALQRLVVRDARIDERHADAAARDLARWPAIVPVHDLVGADRRVDVTAIIERTIVSPER